MTAMECNVVKLRERERHRVDPGSHSKVIYRWWMVDILSLVLYTKFGCHLPSFHPQVS